VLLVLVLVSGVDAQLLRLGVSEQAAVGATHVYEVSASDFTTTASNTAEVIGFNVAAKMSVEFVAMQLVEAFGTPSTDTNITESLTLAVGDEDVAARYMAATQLATESTPIWLSFGVFPAGAVTVTPTTTPLIYVSAVTATDDGTNVTNVAVTVSTNVVMTAASATWAASAVGRHVYTATKEVRLTFTPHAEEATSAFNTGRVRVYFNIRDAR
jgi:hypothetical protein